MDRRQALIALGATAAGAALLQWLGASSSMTPSTGGDWGGRLPPEITPTDRFYTVSKNLLFGPSVDESDWRLDVHGLVGREVALSLDDLRNEAPVDQAATLACISNEVPATAIGNATWRGLRLADVLRRAGGLREGAVDLVFVCADNYTDSIPVAKALDPATLLAYEMNGEPLTRARGYPLRAIVPGIYGMKNAKWIEAIEVVDRDYLGYWQRRGWSDVATYQTLSRIDVPRPNASLEGTGPHTVGGIAFAGDRGIARVELSADAGTTWQPAELKPALSQFSWVLWRLDWRPPTPGSYELTVRATDGTGEVQTAARQDPAPDGATGWHTVGVEVS